jgi:poly(A) polymerase
MRNTDERIQGGASVTPGFLVAVLLWDDFKARLNNADEDPAFASLKAQQNYVAIPRRFGSFAKEVWVIQERLHKRNVRSLTRLVTHKRFRAGYDFLCLQAESDESLRTTADWWTRYQAVDESGRQALIDELPKQLRKRRRSRAKKETASLDSVPLGSS